MAANKSYFNEKSLKEQNANIVYMKTNSHNTNYVAFTPLGNLKFILAKITLQTYYFENQKHNCLPFNFFFLVENVLLIDII